MKIKRAYLQKAVSIVSRVISKSHPVPLLHSVKLSVDNGLLSVSGAGAEGQAFASIPIESGDDVFVLCVNAEVLKTLLTRIPDEEIELEVQKTRLVLKRKAGNIRLAAANAVDFPHPVTPSSPRGSIELRIADLRDTISALLCGTEEEKVTNTPYQNVVQFRCAGPEFLALSSDGNRMTLVDGKCTGDAGTIVEIPLRAIRIIHGAVGELSKAIETVRFYEDDHSIWFFAGNNLAFSLRKMTPCFPDLTEWLTKTKFEMEAVTSVEQMEHGLDLVRVMAGDKPNIRCEIHKEYMQLMADTQDRGKIEERIPLRSAEPFEFVTGYNVQYILPAIRQLQDEIGLAFAKDPRADVTNYSFKISGQIGDIRASYIVQSLQIYPGSKENGGNNGNKK